MFVGNPCFFRLSSFLFPLSSYLKDELWERRLQKDREQCLEKEADEVTQPSFLFSIFELALIAFDTISISEPNGTSHLPLNKPGVSECVSE